MTCGEYAYSHDQTFFKDNKRAQVQADLSGDVGIIGVFLQFYVEEDNHQDLAISYLRLFIKLAAVGKHVVSKKTRQTTLFT